MLHDFLTSNRKELISRYAAKVAKRSPQWGRAKNNAAGCDAYIAKRSRSQELYAAIHSLLLIGREEAGGEADLFLFSS